MPPRGVAGPRPWRPTGTAAAGPAAGAGAGPQAVERDRRALRSALDGPREDAGALGIRLRRRAAQGDGEPVVLHVEVRVLDTGADVDLDRELEGLRVRDAVERGDAEVD